MLNLVKTISTELDNLNRRIVKFLRFGRSDVQTSLQASAPGVDANPIKDMVAVYAATEEKGKTVIVGYINKNQISKPGEYRTFSTNDEGDEETYIYLKDDGTIEIGGASDNMVRFAPLKEGYDKTKDVSDAIVTILTGPPINEPGNGAPSALQAALSSALSGKSTGDIDDSKIDEIKTL